MTGGSGADSFMLPDASGTSLSGTRTITDFETGIDKIHLDALHMPPPWLKLWRDSVWRVLRARDRTRIPFNQRARGESVNVADGQWKDLQRCERERYTRERADC